MTKTLNLDKDGENRILLITIDPPNLVTWLSHEERSSNVMLLDFDADLCENNEIVLHLNVAFQHIRIRRGKTSRHDFYIGTTGAEIELETTNGKVLDYTKEQKLNVDYSKTHTHKKSSAVNIAPKLKAKTNSAESEFEMGSIAYGHGEERSFQFNFSCAERILAVISQQDNIKWVIDKPRVESAIRDYILGNLYLKAECQWPANSFKGSITVRPSDVRFFDREKKPCNFKISLLMNYYFWMHGKDEFNRDGFTTNFNGKY